ncbi:Capsular polysaccharide biosynthesis protein CapD [Gammaproteobacteria bacterium]
MFMLALLDIVLINTSLIVALLLRHEFIAQEKFWQFFTHTAIALTLFELFFIYVFGLYRSLLKYAGEEDLIKIVVAVIGGALSAYAFNSLFGMNFPVSVHIIFGLLTIVLIGFSRLSYRVVKRIFWQINTPRNFVTRVLVIGAGDAGSMLIRELKNNYYTKYMPVAVLDDDKWKWNTSINGVPVKGKIDDLPHFCKQENIDEIIIAIPSASKKRVTEIVKLTHGTGCKLKTLPGLYDIIDDKVAIKNIRDVSIEDLLGREENQLNTAEIASYLKNETVLVTGGGGSIGSELCRQIAKFHPKKLIVLDIYENTAYDLQNELVHTYKKLSLEVVIASIRDIDRLREVFRIYRPGVVFHAAAHKHVPLMENNPSEAVKNNVFGTLNTVRCADEFKVKKFVLISTDKAVNPTNIMGATKRIAETIIQSIDKVSQTEFVAVRFGNVLGSNGSVIPLFKRQIARGGPVTVTHPDITRFFMTIQEASRLVIQAGAMAKGGEIFVLDMGEPVKIINLARDLIRLSGFEPDEDIKIEFIGLKPGEKLYEELLLEEEGLLATRHQGIHVAPPSNESFNDVLKRIEILKGNFRDADDVRIKMSKVVPTYKYKPNKAAIAAASSD